MDVRLLVVFNHSGGKSELGFSSVNKSLSIGSPFASECAETARPTRDQYMTGIPAYGVSEWVHPPNLSSVRSEVCLQMHGNLKGVPDERMYTRTDDYNEQRNVMRIFWIFYSSIPISQIPQYIKQISYNASLCNRNVNKMAFCDMGLVYCGICATGLLALAPFSQKNTIVG